MTLSRAGNLTCPVSSGVVFLGHMDYGQLAGLSPEQVALELEAATQGERGQGVLRGWVERVVGVGRLLLGVRSSEGVGSRGCGEDQCRGGCSALRRQAKLGAAV